MKEFSWTTKHSLDEEQIKDLLTTAIEGGIGYWACLGNDDPNWISTRDKLKQTQEDVFYCDTAYELLVNDLPVILYDEQDDDKKLHLTWDKLIKACQTWEEDNGKNLKEEIDNGNFDAYDADCIIQLAVFNDVVYC